MAYSLSMKIPSKKSPFFHRLIAAALGVLLAGISGCQKSEPPPPAATDTALLQRAMDLQRQVYALEIEKQKFQQDASQAESLRKQFAEEITEFERAKLERDKIKQDFASLDRDYKELIEQLKPINELLTKYENQLRQNLKGEELGNVELRDGRILESAFVEKVAAEWVSLKHSAGISNIDFNMLPDNLQRKFSFRPAMVSTDSLMAQEPVTRESTKPVFSPEDAAKAMHEAMAAERENTHRKQQTEYREKIANLTEEIGNYKALVSRISKERSAKRSEMGRSRKIKISQADKDKAMRGYDYRIQQAEREVMAREAKLSALKSMLAPIPKKSGPSTKAESDPFAG